MRIRIIGTGLPDIPDRHVGLQFGREPVERKAVDGNDVSWEIDVDWKNDEPAGPWVHGKKGDRFIYLVWIDTSTPDNTGGGRTKLKFVDADVDLGPDVSVVVTCHLADDKHGYRMGSLHPPLIHWEHTP